MLKAATCRRAGHPIVRINLQMASRANIIYFTSDIIINIFSVLNEYCCVHKIMFIYPLADDFFMNISLSAGLWSVRLLDVGISQFASQHSILCLPHLV